MQIVHQKHLLYHISKRQVTIASIVYIFPISLDGKTSFLMSVTKIPNIPLRYWQAETFKYRYIYRFMESTAMFGVLTRWR